MGTARRQEHRALEGVARVRGGGALTWGGRGGRWQGCGQHGRISAPGSDLPESRQQGRALRTKTAVPSAAPGPGDCRACFLTSRLHHVSLGPGTWKTASGYFVTS